MSEEADLTTDIGPQLETLVAALAEASAAPAVGAAMSIGASAPVVRTRPADAALRRVEAGSITKPMVGTVLARFVVRGEVSHDAPIRTWLGTGGGITLEHLATHTSGLPRLAPNHFAHDGYDAEDPYAAYGADLAVAGLAAVAGETSPGAYGYSNFGYQLLGLCLERLADAPLAALLDELVFAPLGMTGATADHDVDLDLVPGHADGEPAPPWRILLAGPGGVLAPIADLHRFGAAVLEPPPGVIGDAIRLATEPRADVPGGQVGLGWRRHPAGLIHKDGGTAGFRTEVVVHPERRACVTTFVNDGGFGLGGEMATMAVLGRDPRESVPRPIDPVEVPDEVAIATEVADALGRRDPAGMRRAMAPSAAAFFTDDLILGVWTQVVEPLGPLDDPRVTAIVRRQGLVEVALQGGALRTLVSIDGARRVVGVRVV